MKKAFNTVNYDILLSKLENSYLIGRKQYTTVNGYISNARQTLCGVPQGSVLGPLLFLLYINDLCKSSNKLQFYLFADDTSLTYANGGLKKLETEINEGLFKVCSWLAVNKLTLNIEKINYVIFRPRQKTIPFHPNIKIINNNSNTSQLLEMKNDIRYLGILFDLNLSWKFHINYICQKVSKTIGIIAKLRHFVPHHVLLTLYRSLILPYISYGICAWGHAAETHLHKLLVLQKRALGLMFFADPRTHAVPLFLETK